MSVEMISHVRRFNRTVTQRVGALSDRFLARDRSLGEARLLWEIGAQGRDVRSLRAQLELDSGYVSRLLRSLEAAGLVRVGPTKSDKRVRVARLTRAGLAERAVLAATDPAQPQARHCMREYFAELDRRFDTGFDPSISISAEDDELRPPAGLFLIATLEGKPIGSGALKFHEDGPTEIKRMWVAESARGLGLGRRLLTELEKHAANNGALVVRLETNKSLVEAISLYRSASYVEVAPFNDEPYAHHWFEKRLVRN